MTRSGRKFRRKGVAALCALAASAITIPVVAVEAHGDTCDGGLMNTLIQIGDCEGGGSDAPAATPTVSQQQQQQSAGGGGGGGASSSASSSASSAAGSGD